MTVIRPRTIALDTFFLIRIRDGDSRYDAIGELLAERALIPVICRDQLEEMVRRGGTPDRARQLLGDCPGKVHELPPFYYVMEAEVYAQTVGARISRRNLVARTQWEALQNLLQQLPSNTGRRGRPPIVSDEPLVFSISGRAVTDPAFEEWRGRIEESRKTEPVEKSQRECKRAFLRWFREADARLEYKLWAMPSGDDLEKAVDVACCPCLCTHYNYFCALANTNKRLSHNDYIDAMRVSEAAYVDIFTCDRGVYDLMRQVGILRAGLVACTSPEEVLRVIGS